MNPMLSLSIVAFLRKAGLAIMIRELGGKTMVKTVASMWRFVHYAYMIPFSKIQNSYALC